MRFSPVEPQRPKRPIEGFVPNPKLRLEAQCRQVMHFKRFSLRTEQTFKREVGIRWVTRRLSLFTGLGFTPPRFPTC